MPVVDINPNNSGTILLGLADPPTGDYSCQVINFTLESVAVTTERAGTFCAAPATLNGASSWQVSFEYLQDWGATDSISELFFENDGRTFANPTPNDLWETPIAYLRDDLFYLPRP